MLRLSMDVHAKAAIMAGLRRRGIDVVTAQEDGGTRLEDVALLERATALQQCCSVRMTIFWPLPAHARPRGCSSPGSSTGINSPPPWARMGWIWK